VEVEAVIPGVPLAVSSAAAPAAVEPPAAPTRIPLAAEPSGNHLQLAAFGSRENAEAYAARLRSDVTWLAPQVQIYTRDSLHRVLAGPYATPDEARLAAEKIAQALGVKPLAITR
jgi:rare lipoprotein A